MNINQNQTSSSVPSRPPHLYPKFMTRNLKAHYHIELSLQKIKIKRLYLKSLFDEREFDARKNEWIF